MAARTSPAEAKRERAAANDGGSAEQRPQGGGRGGGYGAQRVRGETSPTGCRGASGGFAEARRAAGDQRRVAETAYSRFPWSMAYPFHVPQEGHRAVHLMVGGPQETRRNGMRYLRL